MSKFLDKKEQVFDIKLTSYGHYLLSVGKFKPSYYAFYDDNILYDKKYADGNSNENQNDIENRIKNETQYLEGQVLFRDVEETLNNGEGPTDWYNQLFISSRQLVPAADVFKLDNPIGDVQYQGDISNLSPAWKFASITNMINSIQEKDLGNGSLIPQINISPTYRLAAVDPKAATTRQNLNNGSVRGYSATSLSFEDDKIIMLKTEDPLCYIEELNTDILNKNFDIEVFVNLSSSNGYDQLERKVFRSMPEQVQNGFLMFEDTPRSLDSTIDTNSVEYYFDVLTDMEINKTEACKGASYFNKQAYYIDLDFDCEEEQRDNIYNDIYGSVTEPEICLD